MTAAVGVGVGGGACLGRRHHGRLDLGVLTGNGVGAAACEVGLSAVFVSAPALLDTTMIDDGGDHADHEYSDAQRQCPASPVNLGG